MIGASRRLVERTRDVIGYTLKHFVGSLNPPLLLAVLGVSWALASEPQLVELYAVELTRETLRIDYIQWAAAAASLFSLVLFGASLVLPDLLVFHDRRFRAPRWSERTRAVAAVSIALLPWIGMALGLASAGDAVATRLEATGLSPGAFDDRRLCGMAVLATGAAAFLAAASVWLYFCAIGRPAYWHSGPYRAAHAVLTLLGWILIGAAVVASVALFLEPSIGWGADLDLGLAAVAEMLGPIASVFLAITTLFTLVVVIVIITGLFAPEMAYLAIFIVIGFTLFASAPTDDMEIETAALPAADRGALALDRRFREWFAARPPAEGDAPFPVYVIAASGGGAYAAAHSAQLLAALQDADPDFASHVFAVSGVSGGAVGATLFNAVAAGAAALDEPFAGPFGQGPRARAVREILLGGHLAPLVLETPGAFLVKGVGGRADQARDRSVALHGSYARAIAALGRDSAGVDGAAAAAWLETPYRESWTPQSRLPSLILNATSVERGALVAFAPFDLAPPSQGAVTSIDEWFDGDPPGVDPLRAAIVSARFPGILPAFTHRGPPPDEKRTNFVDGGYADSSGATTALMIYNAIENALRRDAALAEKVDLRMLLLVGRYATEESGSGTSLVDTLAPLYTVLRVRGQQARRAVGAARYLFEREGKADKLRLIELDVDALALPLAWQISTSTYDAIAASLGTPKRCAGAGPPDDGALATITARNGCALGWALE